MTRSHPRGGTGSFGLVKDGLAGSFFLACLVLLAAGGPVRAGDADRALTVYVAASMAATMTRIATAWQARGGGPVVVVPAASSALARQIARGAPADLFVSASRDWMDWLERDGLVVAGSRVDIAGNDLVLVAPDGAGRDEVVLAPGFDLLAALAGGRLATGDPDHVPAGIYAWQALQWLGAREAVAGRLARAGDVRAAVALVARGETPLGIVYASDARQFAGIAVVGRFPSGSHDAIRYPAAIIAGRDRPATRTFLAWLGGAEARAVLEAAGFTTD